MMSKMRRAPLAIGMIAVLILTACGGSSTSNSPATGGSPTDAASASAPTAAGSTGTSGDGSGVTITYQLWDSNQQPAYQACADAFHEANPNITVQITQQGWGDYWSGIQTGMVGGTAPDVFTNHLAKYPEFAEKNQLVDIQPLVEQDQVDTGQYIEGLADLWTRDGKRFGLPKDWDTVALVYNSDMLTAAGVDPASLEELTWNAQDGGTLGQLIAQLTLDSNGKNGLDPAFDKTKVVQYGYVPQGAGAPFGQTQWSMYAASNGFKFTDGPWATKFYFDDPKVAEAIQWYADLALVQGYAPPVSDYTTNGAGTYFQAGKAALTTDGSWTINDYVTKSSFKPGFAQLPAGPEGRKTMFNGLADSIWTGSQHQAEAWQWVKYAASPACADIVGKTGVVFPAIQSGVEASLAARQEKGLDVSAFTKEALDPEGTFLFPITDHGSEIAAIMSPLLDSVMLGDATAADALKSANDQINALFQ